MLAVFGSEPESVFVLTANGLFTKLSIDAEKGLVRYQVIRPSLLLVDCREFFCLLSNAVPRLFAKREGGE